MATIAWATDVSGNYDTKTNWKGDVAPGLTPDSSDDAFLAGDGGAAYTVTLDYGDPSLADTKIASNATLLLDDAGATSPVFTLQTGFNAIGAINNVNFTVEIEGGSIKGALTNGVDGVITLGSQSVLTIDTAATVVNEGTINGIDGSLKIRSTTVNNDGGTIECLDLINDDIQGGNLSFAQFYGSDVIDGSVQTVVIGSSNVVVAGATLVGEGTINMVGPLTVRGSATFEGAFGPANALIAGVDKGGTLTVDGAVSAGGATIDGGTAIFESSVEGNGAGVDFGKAGGELVLAKAEAFTSPIVGFSTTGASSLDLEDVGFAGAGEATFSANTNGTGVLTIVGTNRTVQIELDGLSQGVTFTAASADGGAASIITASTSVDVARLARFVQATAGFAPTHGPMPLSTSAGEPSASLSLASPALWRH
jgi:hypothetical protein